jgi:hypothetical protein
MKRNFFIAFTLFLVLTFGLVVPGCKKQEIAFNGTDPAGEYTLVSVNGNRVPASISHEGVSLQIRSGTFIINTDGTCISKTVFVPPPGTEVTREVTATYTRDGSRLTMQWKGAGITVGTIQGTIFTMENEGMVFMYRK